GAYVVVYSASALPFLLAWRERESLVGGWVCFVGCVFLGLLGWGKSLLRLLDLSRPILWLQTLAGAIFTGCFLLYGGLCAFSWMGHETSLNSWISPVLSLCLMLALMTAIGGFLAVAFPRTYLLVYLGLFLLVFVASNYPHFKLRFRELDGAGYYDDKGVYLPGEDLQPWADLRRSFSPQQAKEEEQWLEEQYQRMLDSLTHQHLQQWRAQESKTGIGLEDRRRRLKALNARIEKWRLEHQCETLLARLTADQKKDWNTWAESAAANDLEGLRDKRNGLLQFLELEELCRLHTWKNRITA